MNWDLLIQLLVNGLIVGMLYGVEIGRAHV